MSFPPLLELENEILRRAAGSATARLASSSFVLAASRLRALQLDPSRTAA